ncbi:MAG TPA: Asd/ArgC dimerization domain-containing protein [Candidatus Polarisedimenticolia bacterium]
MAADGARIAFFGSTSLLAREIRSTLERRGFHAADVRLYDHDGEGTLSEYEGEVLLVTRPDPDAIPDLDIAFMCGTPAETEPYLDWPASRGYVAIDMSGASMGRPGVPLVHTEINPGAIMGAGGATARAPIIGAPHPIPHNLASVVAAARREGPIHSVEAFALRPASELGNAGIDELYQQTVSLLNLSSVPQEVFGRQVAFNVVPSAAMAANEQAGLDSRAEVEAISLLAMEPGRISITSALATLFHGHALAVTLSFERPPDLASLRERLGSARGLRQVEELSSFSPVDLAGEEDVAFIGPTQDRRRPGKVGLWLFCDNLKGGAALNAVKIAERVADRRGGEA